jgi:hypothetical protein
MVLLPTRFGERPIALCFSKTHLFDATGRFRRVLKGEGSRMSESEAKAVPLLVTAINALRRAKAKNAEIL